MMSRGLFIALVLFGAVGCAQQPSVEFVPSRKSATELRAMQTRAIDGDPDSVIRGVIATLHDLGYRITRADAETGTISATKQTALRMAVVVRPRPPGQSIVRANATIVGLGREAQVDSPEFYAANFFRPLGEMMQRDPALLSDQEQVPDAAQPVAERSRRGTAPATGSRAPAGPSSQERNR